VRPLLPDPGRETRRRREAEERYAQEAALRDEEEYAIAAYNASESAREAAEAEWDEELRNRHYTPHGASERDLERDYEEPMGYGYESSDPYEQGMERWR
jgi:hypothetical protein